MMELSAGEIRGHRLRAHHLDKRLPQGSLEEAAGACGFQNSPPGAWETAAWARVEGCTREGLERALYEEKSLLQAWSFRGGPVVFPAARSGVFLTPLAAREGEEPWIYTQGIGLALDYLGMEFSQLLPLVAGAAGCLDGRTVKSKEALDQLLAGEAEKGLPPEKLPLWRAPSLYGRPDRQTVGGAVVSFLLRPCAFRSLVVFGRREGNTPTFTSFRSWTGREPGEAPGGDRELVRRFLHCYGPAAPALLGEWLGCSPRQAARLWAAAEEEMVPVRAGGKVRYLLAEDLAGVKGGEPEERLLLLGPHDPYLDLRDREIILEDPARRRRVWQTVSNPGVVLRGGRAAGVWTGKVKGGRLEFSADLWEPFSPKELRALEELGEEYAAFRRLTFSFAKKKK